MAISTIRVAPGDLITADLMNQILDRLAALEASTGGGAAGELKINFPFPGAVLRMGDELHIIGQGFGVPATNTVSIDATPQTLKPGGSDGELILDIKNVQGVGLGKTVTLLVSNTRGSASTQFNLLPFEQTIPTGSLTVFMSKPPPDANIIGRPAPYPFTFSIKAFSSLAEDYDVKVTIDQPSWAATPDAPVINFPKSDPPNGTTKDVVVNVNVPPGAPPATVGHLSVAVVSKKNPAELKNIGNTTITVGAAPQPGQDKVVATFTNTVEGNATINGDTVEIKKDGQEVNLIFKAFVKQNGKYNITALLDNATGWTTKPVASFTANNASSNNPSQNDLDVSLKTSAGSAAQATNLQVKVTLETDATIFGQVTQKISPKP